MPERTLTADEIIARAGDPAAIAAGYNAALAEVKRTLAESEAAVERAGQLQQHWQAAIAEAEQLHARFKEARERFKAHELAMRRLEIIIETKPELN